MECKPSIVPAHWSVSIPGHFQSSRTSPLPVPIVSHLPLPPIKAAFSGGVHVSYLQVIRQVRFTTSSSVDRFFRTVPPSIVHARPSVSPVPNHLLLRSGRRFRHRRARARADVVSARENILWFGRMFASNGHDRGVPGTREYSLEAVGSAWQGLGCEARLGRSAGSKEERCCAFQEACRRDGWCLCAALRFVAERREETKVGCWFLFWTDALTKDPRSKAVEASWQRTIPSSLMLFGASRRLIRGVANSAGRSLAMHGRMPSNAHPDSGESPSTSRPSHIRFRPYPSNSLWGPYPSRSAMSPVSRCASAIAAASQPLHATF